MEEMKPSKKQRHYGLIKPLGNSNASLMITVFLFLGIFMSGCIGDKTIDPLYSSENDPDTIVVVITDEINDKQTAVTQLKPSTSAEQLEHYITPNVPESYCKNLFKINGNVKLERFNDEPLPMYVVKLEIQPAGQVPINYDGMMVEFDPVGTEYIYWIGNVVTSTKVEGQEDKSTPGRVLQPGEIGQIEVNSVNGLNRLLANSSNGNISLNVGIYNESKLIGAFHARLPTVYETNGRPAEITVDETQQLLFQDYETVRSEVDANFSVNIWYEKGVVLGELGKYEDAIQAYDKATKINPQNELAWNNKGTALYNLGRYEEAIQAYDKAIEIDSNDSEIWNNKGNALYNMGRYEEAIQVFNKAIDIDPHYADSWCGKGYTLYSLGKSEEAIKAFDKAIEIDANDSEIWNNKGYTLYNLGRYEEAIQAYDKAIETDANDSEVWNNKGTALHNLGRYEEAIQAYDKAIEIDPQYAIAWDNKGASLDNLGKREEAVFCYKKAKEFGN